jgi:hypothetical protein
MTKTLEQNIQILKDYDITEEQIEKAKKDLGDEFEGYIEVIAKNPKLLSVIGGDPESDRATLEQLTETDLDDLEDILGSEYAVLIMTNNGAFDVDFEQIKALNELCRKNSDDLDMVLKAFWEHNEELCLTEKGDFEDFIDFYEYSYDAKGDHNDFYELWNDLVQLVSAINNSDISNDIHIDIHNFQYIHSASPRYIDAMLLSLDSEESDPLDALEVALENFDEDDGTLQTYVLPVVIAHIQKMSDWQSQIRARFDGEHEYEQALHSIFNISFNDSRSSSSDDDPQMTGDSSSSSDYDYM